MVYSIVGNFKFRVENGVLTRITPLTSAKNIDVFIPKTLSDGTVIDCIGAHFAFGVPYGTITISDEITEISSWAFSRVEAKEIVWPSGCLEIPSHCFPFCTAACVRNLENVQYVNKSAFWCSEIKEINWPPGVSVIPDSCFGHCKTSKITGLDAVASVEDYAFCESNILVMSWPDNCQSIPRYCFKNCKIGFLNNLGCVTRIEEGAFYGASVCSALDFSHSLYLECDDSAFESAECNTVLPYYSAAT